MVKTFKRGRQRVTITQLHRRIQKLETISKARNSDPLDLAGSWERVLQRLSVSDRRLIKESSTRSDDQDHSDLKEVWARFEVAANQAFEEGDSFFNADDWRC
jgi:hypothetical protein